MAGHRQNAQPRAGHLSDRFRSIHRHTGHMQRQYHPAFSALCPGIPRFGGTGSFGGSGAVPRTFEEFPASGRRAQAGAPDVPRLADLIRQRSTP